ncbi:MAPK-activated protein kinase Srk1 [Coemansia sp. RSA 2523]|nr:MAPK-activated protein kinase Srk1 [Coemansia sp. RSA 1591]KAJ1763427.1 MAPK-activated protein kinase Srk1 [Coemansia sp. RSA 1752]KAJ1777071.1 MAPK-activated protein kinase Srk1 [Coemansia sp. RSA 1824]KAJ1789645.1 MAPK-activated protein kinase Srk1 [Coemansia sp. RSA 1938]KAJ1807329.1 MAPK-activated protein kinase Srk1 [Coemansia sp. RSA 2523]KAJ2148974.1 MAPK-activated protein kinase Srk1 [Coemansia sp. RSA 564]KAJ2169554.1 MAPK-activated protein kinase Srk1 [Coemansia sp. RSA 562]KAJ2
MGIFNNNSNNASSSGRVIEASKNSRVAVGGDIRTKSSRSAKVITRRRRRSVDNFKETQFAVESSSDDDRVIVGRGRRNSNAGTSRGADVDGNGFPAIEGYEVLSRIGEGAFSKVYRARQRATGDDVAVKAICKTGLSSVQIANIHKEIAIMESLRSPRIIKLIAVRETRDYFYLVMEFAEGGEMFDRVLQLTYLSERLARHVIIQVAEAVQYLHANGVVQRDLKLENVVFEPIPIVSSGVQEQKRQGDTAEKMEEGLYVPGVGGGGIGRVKLIDFGLSKVVWNQATHTPCGTTGYAAPEVVRDELYTKSVDMWGLGCMLYAMVCGFPPFYDEDVKVLTRKVALGQYEFLSPWWDKVNPQIKHLISRLLELDPAQRYTIQDFMRHPWIVAGINEMYDSAAVAAAARSSVHRRRNTNSRLLQLGLRQPFGAVEQGQFSPRNTMKNAYDLAFAMRRLGDDESAHLRYASTPTWDAAFGQYGIKSPAPNANRMREPATPRTQNMAGGWVNIQAVATPIQQRHCWQGTMGSPVDIHAAEADMNLISKVLDMPAKKHRMTLRSKQQPVTTATSGNKFALNMGEATLLKRRFVA